MKRRISWLFVPGDDPRKISRALASRADAVILDLEDSVATERKAAARAIVAEVLAGAEPAGRCFVRVNTGTGAGSLQWRYQREDLAAAGSAAGIVLPKCEGPRDVIDIAAGLKAGQEIVAIVTETARGVQCLSDFREPVPGLAGLMWGAEDLNADLHGRSNRGSDGNYHGPYAAARNATLVAARAVGVSAIDAVFTAFRDHEALARECGFHRALGFDAKAAIHPDQLSVIHAAFTPGEEEMSWARQVLGAVEHGKGVAQLDGRMLDLPHVRQARRILGLPPRDE